MIKIWKYGFIGVLIALIILFTYKNIPRSEEIDMIDIDSAHKLVIENLERVEKVEEKIFEHISEDFDVGHMEEYDQHSFQAFKDKKGVVEYLFATINMNDPELFLHAFDTETISEDLFKSENPNKLEVIQEFINEITRNGKLDKVGYEEKAGVFGVKTNEANILLYYNDGIKVTVPLAFQKMETSHHEGNGAYFINTSVLEIINIIKKS